MTVLRERVAELRPLYVPLVASAAPITPQASWPIKVLFPDFDFHVDIVPARPCGIEQVSRLPGEKM